MNVRQKQKQKRKLLLESLEDRYALATGTVSGGSLTITDSSAAGADLLIEQIAANQWRVSDGGAPITGSPFNGVTGNVTVRTGSGDDSVEIDLGGFLAPKNLVVRDNAGDNTFNIHNGSIKGVLDFVVRNADDDVTIDGLEVRGQAVLNLGHGDNTLSVTDSTFAKRTVIATGLGEDTVTLGDGAADVDFGNLLQVLDYGGPDDTLAINDGVTVAGSLSIDNFNTTTIDAQAELQSHFYYSGGFNVPNSLTVDAVIDGNVYLSGSGDVETINFSSSSSVGGSVTAYLRGGNDDATFSGAIGRALTADAGAGNDSLTLEGTMGTFAKLLLGTGNDVLEFTGTIGVAPATSSKLTIDAGSGDDQIAIRDNAEINGQVTVNMAAGNDAFYLSDDASVTSASINGGTGSDEYYGDPDRANVVDKFFEIFDLLPPF